MKRRILSFALAFIMALGLSPVLPSRGAAGLITFTGGYSGTYDGNAPQTFNIAADAAVTGTLSGVGSTLTLNISAGATVTWNADYSGTANPLIRITGGGTFNVAGGEIVLDGAGNTSDSVAVYSNSSSSHIRVTGGTVESTPSYSRAIQTYGTVTVTAGKVTAPGGVFFNNSNDFPTVMMNGSGSILTVTGGIVEATGSTGCAIGSEGSVNVGGNAQVFSTREGIWVTGSGTVAVEGNALVKAGGGVSFPRAIFAESGSNYTITVRGNAVVEADATYQSYVIGITSGLGKLVVEENAVVRNTGTWANQAFGFYANNGADIEVKGGQILGNHAIPICVTNTSSDVTITGGLVFSYADKIDTSGNSDMNAAVSTTPAGAYSLSGTGAVVAWDRNVWNSHIKDAAPARNYYVQNTDEGLRIAGSPSAAVRWKEDGVFEYSTGAWTPFNLSEDALVKPSPKVPLYKSDFHLSNSNYLAGSPDIGKVESSYERFVKYGEQKSNTFIQTSYTGTLLGGTPYGPSPTPPPTSGEYKASVTIANNDVFAPDNPPFEYDFTVSSFVVDDVGDGFTWRHGDSYTLTPPVIDDPGGLVNLEY